LALERREGAQREERLHTVPAQAHPAYTAHQRRWLDGARMPPRLVSTNCSLNHADCSLNHAN
jgi:hypothetical protein